MSFTDPRQSPQWGKYLGSIGWKIVRINGRQVFIRKIPLINRSVIKIQKAQNPLPLKQLDAIANQNKALFTLVEPHYQNFKESDLSKQGFRKTKILLSQTATVHLDLTISEKKLWKSFSENARRNIRKSQRSELEVKVINLSKEKDDLEFKKFYKLLQNLTKIRKFYVPGYDEYYKKMQAFKKTSYLLFAYHHSAPIAVIWLAGYRGNIVYVQTGITKKGYELLANYRLVWEGLKLAKKLKYRLFEFEGIYDPRFPWEKKKWANFSEFKKRFHGRIIEYPQPMIKIYSPWFQLIYFMSKILP